jgi:hypothetical protein
MEKEAGGQRAGGGREQGREQAIPVIMVNRKMSPQRSPSSQAPQPGKSLAPVWMSTVV